MLVIGEPQRIEGDGAKAGIGYVGRNRGGTIGRSDGAGDETLAAVFLFGELCCLAREPGAFGVELVSDLRHAVIGLGDAGR